jgi:hypothetical protein
MDQSQQTHSHKSKSKSRRHKKRVAFDDDKGQPQGSKVNTERTEHRGSTKHQPKTAEQSTKSVDPPAQKTEQQKSYQFEAKNEGATSQSELSAEEIIQKIRDNPDFVKSLSAADAVKYIDLLNPYRQQVNTTSTEYTCVSYLPMRDQHIMNIDLVTIIGYIYRCHFEYEDLMDISDEVRNSPQYKEAISKNKKVILDFLDRIFEYNPERDVRSSYIPPNPNATRKPLKCTSENKVAPIAINGSGVTDCDRYVNTDRVQEAIHKICNLKQDGALSTDNLSADSSFWESIKVLEDELKPAPVTRPSKQRECNDGYSTLTGICNNPSCKCRQLSTFQVPSRDLFHRLTRYRENNWDKFVKIASDLYADKIDLETAIQVHKSFRSLKDATTYQKEHGTMCMIPMMVVKNGPWTITTPCKENQRNVDYFGKGTSELEDIFKRAAADEKLGNEMIAKKIKRKKKQNILRNRGDVPDERGVEKWSEENSFGMSKKKLLTDEDKRELDEYARDVRDGKVNPQEIYEYVDEEGIPLDAVQVGVHEYDGKEIKSYTMFTKADEHERPIDYNTPSNADNAVVTSSGAIIEFDDVAERIDDNE